MPCLLLALTAPAAVPSADDARIALRKATHYLTSISTEGGYVWSYSVDLQERRGEGPATPTQIWVQPPGTPSVGQAFLRAFAATGDDIHWQAARAAARALVRGQLESGGWAYRIEFDPRERRRWAYRVDLGEGAPPAARQDNTSTFDDDNTQSALRFLLEFCHTAKTALLPGLDEVQAALDYGLAKMIEAQYPNGAWPQRYEGRPHDPSHHPVRNATIPAQWPREWPRARYGQFYTLNDNAQRDCILLMLEAHRRTGRPEYLAAAKRGGKFLLLAQLPEPQPAWAQQYNFEMEPAWARAFEPPAVCAGESSGVIRTLMDLYLETGEEEFLRPVPAALAWFERSQIAPGRWARFYELGTNRPIYGDRDGRIHYDLAEVSAERRRGYSWQGGYGVRQVIADYEALRREGREQTLARRRKQDPGPALTTLAEQVATILSQQDDQGRWLSRGRLEMRTFIRHMQALADYISRKRAEEPANDQPNRRER